MFNQPHEVSAMTKFVATLDHNQNVTGAYEVPTEYVLKSSREVFITEQMYAQWQLIATVQQAMKG
jgi:hypothetical protein